MAIDHQDIVAHAMVEGEFGEDVHACIAKLERDHCKVRLANYKVPAPSSLVILHFGNLTVVEQLRNRRRWVFIDRE